jgi:hypothetical protein
MRVIDDRDCIGKCRRERFSALILGSQPSPLRATTQSAEGQTGTSSTCCARFGKFRNKPPELLEPQRYSKRKITGDLVAQLARLEQELAILQTNTQSSRRSDSLR